MIAKFLVEHFAQDFFVAVPAVDAAAIDPLGRRQVSRHIGGEGQEVGINAFAGGRQNGIDRARRQRQQVIEILHLERAAIALDLNLAFLNRPAVVIAQNRHQHTIVERFFLRFPIDIEIGRIPA